MTATYGPCTRDEWEVFLDATAALPENTSHDDLSRAGLVALRNYRQAVKDDG